MLTPKQQKAVALLAGGISQKDAAKIIGVAPETICRWNADVDFSCEVDDLKRQMTETAVDILRGCIVDAANAVKELLACDKPDAIRLRAAATVLQLTNQQPALALPKSSAPANWTMAPMANFIRAWKSTSATRSGSTHWQTNFYCRPRRALS